MASEWLPESPQSSTSTEDEAVSIDTNEDHLDNASSDTLGFVPYEYPITTIEAKVDSAIWDYHNNNMHNTLDIKSIIRAEVISSDNRSGVDIQAATWNINGGLHQHRQKFTSICWLFSAAQMDVLVLTDTRLTESESVYITKQAKALLPPGTQLRHAHISASGKGTRIGGQIVIISHRWSNAIANFSRDDSPFGLVTALTLKCAHQTLMIVGSYWPCKCEEMGTDVSVTKGTLWQRVSHWQSSFTPVRPGSPIDYVQSVIMKKTINMWHNQETQLSSWVT